MDAVRCAAAYADPARRLVLALKHGDRHDVAPVLGRWMAAMMPDDWREAVLVPVPLHWTRLLRRQHNQAALLAKAVSRTSALPWLPHVLARTRRTASQGHASPAWRRRNVAGAFSLRDTEAVAGKSVVLVDDVLTTGATLSACARVLREGGATQVHALCAARAMPHGTL